MVTLALAIGANATMFGVIDRLLLSAPPLIASPDQVVRIEIESTNFIGERFTTEATSYAVFQDFRDGTSLFAHFAAVSPAEAILGRGESAISVTASRVSGSYFELLGVAPALGRFFTEFEDQPPTAIDVGVLATTAGAALIAGLVAGLLPALQVSASAPGRATTPGHDDVVVKRSFLRGGVLLAEIKFQGEIPGLEQDAIYRDAIERVRRIPEVDLAIAVQAIPFGRRYSTLVGFPGKDFATLFGDRQIPYYHAVEPEFFELMGVEVIEGRVLRHADDATAPPATVISQSLASYVWPDESAVGKCMRGGMPPDMELELEILMNGAPESVPCYEIVGVVSDISERSLLPEYRLTMQWYTTFEQTPPAQPEFTGGSQIWGMLIRTSGDVEAVAGAVQRVMQASSDQIPYVDIKPYTDLINPRTRSWQLGAAMFSAFGGLALVIAAIGMYGVLAYAVAQHTREMGVRMALGARALDVVRLVVVQALRVVIAGVVLGGAAALWAARYIEALLYETNPSNPLVLVGVVVLLGVVAVLASTVPAIRATRTDPRVALTEG